jgi:hypothetical protein
VKVPRYRILHLHYQGFIFKMGLKHAERRIIIDKGVNAVGSMGVG